MSPMSAVASSGTEVATLQNFVDGHWVAAAASETLADHDPATGELLAQVPLSGAADVDAAVRAARARAARPGATCRRRVAPARLFALRDVLVDHREELARAGHRRHGQDARRRATPRSAAGSSRSRPPAPSRTC